MKSLSYLLATASVVMLSLVATTHAQIGGIINDADRTFLQTTSQGAAYEMIGGQLPRSHSNTGVVRKLGDRISRANQRESTRVKALALRVGVSVSIKPSTDQVKDLEGLGNLFNTDFDRTFVNKEITTILNDIRDSLVVIRDGSNLAVRAFARRRLPGLYSQLQASIITAQQIGLPLQ